MSQVTKIKKDSIGLYVLAGGWVCRPFFGTTFNEGDEVKTHHFGGSTLAGVGNPDEADFRGAGTYENWSTTGITGREYKDMSEQEILEKTNWYYENGHLPSFIYKKYNKEYAKKVGKDLVEDLNL